MPWLVPHADPNPQERVSVPNRLVHPSSVWPPKSACWAILGLLLIAAIWYEAQTSALQSYVFSKFSARLSFETEAGPNSQVVFPRDAPYDRELGYSLLPRFNERLDAQGYRITAQARMSRAMAQMASLGIAPPYFERSAAGLVVTGARDEVVFNARHADRLFDRFDDVPVPVVQSLLFIENRDLLAAQDPRRNPAVEWDRLFKAGLLYAGRGLGMDLEVQGGSTLATQIEKFRHSPEGRTQSALDKLRQMTAASLKVYRQGIDTRAERRRIVVDYLNSMPLAAVPRYGEVLGLGEGLHAWFGLDLDEVRAALASSEDSAAKAFAFKHVLALLCAVRAPTRLLSSDRTALEARVAAYTRLMEREKIITPQFGQRVRRTPLHFVNPAVSPVADNVRDNKETMAVRTQLLSLLGVPGFYELDRLDLQVESSIDLQLQRSAGQLLRQLHEPTFLAAHGLHGERLLSQGDPSKVIYSLLLYEITPQGNLLRLQTDSFDRPFDVNTGMKMELGSTAKLRTVTHYLEIVTELYADIKNSTAAKPAALPNDPITRWAAATLEQIPDMDIETFLQQALDRTYSANPGELFFTGGGAHVFHNFDRRDDSRVLSVRTGLQQSTNLVFIRLMRDLVRVHAVRLPYDAEAVISNVKHPQRRRLLEETADEEAMHTLARAHASDRGLNDAKLIAHTLHGRLSPRRLAILFYSWHPGAGQDALAHWLHEHAPGMPASQVPKLARAYGNPRLTLADYGYLLDAHPLEIWCAGVLQREPDLSFDELNARAADAKRVSSAWLFQTRNRRAQDLRLRIRVEQDAFARMTPYWRRLGFPFEHLVPSYATAIGSSTDRPAALAELMGIIVNNGVRRPAVMIEKLRFAADTPYHTVFEPDWTQTEQVMQPPVAGALQALLADVVEQGTARRVKGVFHAPDGLTIRVGGKTGSGDNRFETFSRGGYAKSSRAVNRTATFVFYIGHRYYGVVTASVDGSVAQNYRFTSALPLEVLKLLAPQIQQRMSERGL